MGREMTGGCFEQHTGTGRYIGDVGYWVVTRCWGSWLVERSIPRDGEADAKVLCTSFVRTGAVGKAVRLPISLSLCASLLLFTTQAIHAIIKSKISKSRPYIVYTKYNSPPRVSSKQGDTASGVRVAQPKTPDAIHPKSCLPSKKFKSIHRYSREAHKTSGHPGPQDPVIQCHVRMNCILGSLHPIGKSKKKT